MQDAHLRMIAQSRDEAVRLGVLHGEAEAVYEECDDEDGEGGCAGHYGVGNGLKGASWGCGVSSEHGQVR